MTLRSTSSGSETTSVPSASIDDLDLGAFQGWLDEHARRLAGDEVPHEDALLQLRLAASMGSRVHPTIAGLYVFGHEPQFSLPNLGVVCAKFEGTSMTDEIVARKDVTGPLQLLLDGALEFVEQHAQNMVNQVNPAESTIEFPRRAVREAVVNALIHRDLRAGGPVAVRLFDDRLEVWNPGPPSGLPRDIEHYVHSGGVSLPRNPLLAVLARQLGLAEQLGRGLALMHRIVDEEAHARLIVEGTKEGVLVTIPSALQVLSSRGDSLAN